MANISLRILACYILGHMILGVALGTGLYMGPYFPTPQTRNITVHQNAVAYLPCTVKQLGDKSVSWVRQRDADILTVDRYTFVRDERLTVHYAPSTETWTLVIKYVQERDAGTYECQISTEPKMSMWLHLNVIVPQVEIVGEVDKYIRKGSTTRLECKVSSTVQLPDYIFWYHSGERLLEYDNPRVKFSVSRRGGQGSEMSITSLLIISNTQPIDEGNYTCLPSNLHSATTNLHVLNDEHPAAMQTGAAMLTDPPSTWGMMMVVLIAFIFVQAHHNFNLSTGAPGHGIVLARKVTSVSAQRSVTANAAFHTTGDLHEDSTGKEIVTSKRTTISNLLQAELLLKSSHIRGLLFTGITMYWDGSKSKKKPNGIETIYCIQHPLVRNPSCKLTTVMSLIHSPDTCIVDELWRSRYQSILPFVINRKCVTDNTEKIIFVYDDILCHQGHPSRHFSPRQYFN